MLERQIGAKRQKARLHHEAQNPRCGAEADAHFIGDGLVVQRQLLHVGPFLANGAAHPERMQRFGDAPQGPGTSGDVDVSGFVSESLTDDHGIESFRSSQEALDVCARERVDVILLDVMMPGMDGYETCRRIKRHPRTHHAVSYTHLTLPPIYSV